MGGLKLGTDFEQARASIFANVSVTMPKEPPERVDVLGLRDHRQHLNRAPDVVGVRLAKQFQGGASRNEPERRIRRCALGDNCA